jgi:dehydrogenase/reductase SDR family protein 1
MDQNTSTFAVCRAMTSSLIRPLEGQIALVTGASRGIGRGIALQLGQAGATVYITGRQPPNSLGNTETDLPSLEQTAKGI